MLLNLKILRVIKNLRKDKFNFNKTNRAYHPDRIVFNITGGPDMTLMEVNAVSEVVTSLADPNANVIFGSVVDEKHRGEIAVTIVATGFQPAGPGGKFRESPSRRAPAPEQKQEEPQLARSESALPWNRSEGRRGGSTVETPVLCPLA